MKRRLLCIEVGVSVTKVCDIEYRDTGSGTKVSLKSSFTVETPAGCVAEAELFELDTLAFRIKEELGNRKIHTKDVVFALNSSAVVSSGVDVPYQKLDSQLVDIVRAKSEEGGVFPVSLDGKILAVSRLSSQEVKDEETGKKKKVVKVMGYLAPETLVVSYRELARLSKLHMVACDYSGNASYRILSDVYPTGSIVTVHITDCNTIVSAIKDGILMRQRILDFGYVEASLDITAQDRLFGSCTVDEAFDLMSEKNMLDVDNFDVSVEFEGKSESELDDIEGVVSSTLDKFQTLLSGVASFVAMYKQQCETSVDKIVYISERSNFPDLVESFEADNNIPCEKLENSLSAKGGTNVSIAFVLSCLGAGISPANFNIAESEEVRKSILFRKIAFGMVVATGAVCSLWTLSALMSLNSAKTDRKVMENKLSGASAAQRTFTDYQLSDLVRSSVAEFDADAYTRLNDIPSILADIEACTPTGRVEYVSVLGSEGVLSLSIVADSKATVASYLDELEKLDWFYSVDVKGLTESEDADMKFKSGRVVTVSIQCTLWTDEEEAALEGAGSPVTEEPIADEAQDGAVSDIGGLFSGESDSGSVSAQGGVTAVPSESADGVSSNGRVQDGVSVIESNVDTADVPVGTESAEEVLSNEN